MDRYPEGKDKYRGKWRYFRCTTCAKPVKIYLQDCLNKKFPKVVDVCKNCLPKILKKKD